ncbi:DUF6378 domain-containing protein [Lysobacter olei]
MADTAPIYPRPKPVEPVHMHHGSAYVERNPDEFLTDEQMEEIRDANRFDTVTAPAILRDAAQAIDNRAALRDCPQGERSMGRCVTAFNAITGHALTEVQGWHFMELLKLARATAGGHHLDDHTDRAAYAALAGEAAERAKA